MWLTAYEFLKHRLDMNAKIVCALCIDRMFRKELLNSIFKCTSVKRSLSLNWTKTCFVSFREKKNMIQQESSICSMCFLSHKTRCKLRPCSIKSASINNFFCHFVVSKKRRGCICPQSLQCFADFELLECSTPFSSVRSFFVCYNLRWCLFFFPFWLRLFSPVFFLFNSFYLYGRKLVYHLTEIPNMFNVFFLFISLQFLIQFHCYLHHQLHGSTCALEYSSRLFSTRATKLCTKSILWNCYSLSIYIHIYAAQSITRSAFISIIYLSLNSIAPAASLYNCETI